MALNKAVARSSRTRARPTSDRGARPQSDQGPGQDVSTYLVIPYFPGDLGRPGVERPLPAGVPSWVCPAIIVNDQPGQNTFTRGQPTRVTVDVGNYGAGTMAAPTYVRVWWSDPSTGFTVLNLFGQDTLAIPNSAVRRTKEMVGVIPASAPPHVCLLANVWSPMDTGSSSATPDPVNDRRWAQLNINDLTVAPGKPFQFIFWLGNPLAHEAAFDVTASALPAEATSHLQRLRRAEWKSVQPAALRLGDAHAALAAGDMARGEARARVRLRPGERRAMLLTGALPKEATAGATAVIEVISTASGDGHAAGAGSLGLLVHVRD